METMVSSFAAQSLLGPPLPLLPVLAGEDDKEPKFEAVAPNL